MSPRNESPVGGAAPAQTGHRARPDLRRELLLGLLVFGAYLLVDLVDLTGNGRRARADADAEWLYRLEQSLHIDIEGALNRALAPHEVLSTLANYEYATTYIISALLLLGWAYVRAPEIYRRARSSFVALNLLAITCFALVPLSPPRLLAEHGFVDTVLRGSTAGSWGSPLVSHANQLAAMPSLHVAWALWVSVVLARLARGPVIQLVSAAHVALTVYVVVATANHFVLDAVASVPLVLLSVWPFFRAGPPGTRVPSADMFFLHVESTGAAQHVGGVALLAEHPAPSDQPSLAAMRCLVRSELSRLPRFTQRLWDRGRWRRARWVEAGELDWEWHVTERRIDALTFADGLSRTHAEVARLARTPMPRDRPLWRIVMLRGVGPGRSVMVLLVHHAMGDGIGTVLQAMKLFRPTVELPAPAASEPGTVRRSLAVLGGLAQLAADGRPAAALGRATAERGFGTVRLPFERVQQAARANHARVTDVVLSLVAAGVTRTHPGLVDAARRELRVAVPVLVRAPRTGPVANLTAAAMLDLPLGEPDPARVLAEVRRRSGRIRTPTRALASRFVMAGLGEAVPEPALRWFARTVYGQRFFHGVVSNMPGPPVQLSVADVQIEDICPILPLAPGAPLALGALTWTGTLGVGVATDPATLDADTLAAAVGEALDTLEASAAPACPDRDAGHPAYPPSPAGSAPVPREDEEQSRA